MAEFNEDNFRLLISDMNRLNGQNIELHRQLGELRTNLDRAYASIQVLESTRDIKHRVQTTNLLKAKEVIEQEKAELHTKLQAAEDKEVSNAEAITKVESEIQGLELFQTYVILRPTL